MRINYLFFVGSLFCLIGLWGCGDEAQFSTTCVPANLQNGVIAFYPFSNGSLDDASSFNNDLTNATTAIPTSDRNGNSNCAYLFSNDSSTYEALTLANPTFLDGLSSFSVSIWYQPLDTTRPGGEFEVLLSRGDQGRCPDRSGEWSLALYDCRRAVFGHDNSVWAEEVSDISISGCQGEINELTDQWHHVVAVKNGNSFQIYFDGVLHESTSGAGNCGGGNQLAQDIGDLYIGQDFVGRLDDILIYDRALASTEVMNLFLLDPCCE